MVPLASPTAAAGADYVRMVQHIANLLRRYFLVSSSNAATFPYWPSSTTSPGQAEYVVVDGGAGAAADSGADREPSTSVMEEAAAKATQSRHTAFVWGEEDEEEEEEEYEGSPSVYGYKTDCPGCAAVLCFDCTWWE